MRRRWRGPRRNGATGPRRRQTTRETSSPGPGAGDPGAARAASPKRGPYRRSSPSSAALPASASSSPRRTLRSGTYGAGWNSSGLWQRWRCSPPYRCGRRTSGPRRTRPERSKRRASPCACGSRRRSRGRTSSPRCASPPSGSPGSGTRSESASYTPRPRSMSASFYTPRRGTRRVGSSAIRLRSSKPRRELWNFGGARHRRSSSRATS
mmetsp:Transcript_15097/g.51787  ORF Transcript_15097/g.51787 Transcript_15097/m.51787 type:complete len:209 (-) Transcript_15097:274-900(-)